MGVRADQDQADGDTVLTLRLQEIRDWHPVSVREVAGRWEQGLRGLLGLIGVTGLVGAPLAAENLTRATQATVGIVLSVVLLAAGAGLMLTMSAAYGSVRLVRAPASMTELESLRWSLAERARIRLVWGRRLAVGALVLFALSITVAWINPSRDGGPLLHVETSRGMGFCGDSLTASQGVVAVGAEVEGRIEIPVGDIVSIKIVEACP